MANTAHSYASFLRDWPTTRTRPSTSKRIQPTPEGDAAGKALICLDAVVSGAGELIYFCGGKESSFPFLPVETPVDRTIVGIVDELNVDRNARRPA